jgi:hypothetical protein
LSILSVASTLTSTDWATDNRLTMQVAKVSTGKVLEHRQAEHRDRVKKIMTRKPGSSVTMDNRPPETVAAIANNPRKISIKMHLSHTREQDNKCVHGICVVGRCVATQPSPPPLLVLVLPFPPSTSTSTSKEHAAAHQPHFDRPVVHQRRRLHQNEETVRFTRTGRPQQV